MAFFIKLLIIRPFTGEGGYKNGIMSGYNTGIMCGYNTKHPKKFDLYKIKHEVIFRFLQRSPCMFSQVVKILRVV